MGRRYYWRELRLRRIRHRVQKQEMAERLGCSLAWLSTLELYDYRGPAADVWAEKYVAALDEMVVERRARAAKTG